MVAANGACALANVPQFSQALPDGLESISLRHYKRPQQIREGGVLVVGGSASGVQIAAELCEAGHPVTLAVGEHIRVPRRYRGYDIQWWMERSSILDTRIEDVDDIFRARRVPSLQLI